jgi:hypothetical protein
MLKEMAPNVSYTFNFGYLIRPDKAQTCMKTFMNAVQDKVYGRDWAKQTNREWPYAMGFFEHPDTNPHYHVLARLDQKLVRYIETQGNDIWRNIARRGQLDVKDVYAPDGIWSYVTKRLAEHETFDDVWVYKDTRAITVGSSSLVVGKESGWL